MEVSNLISICPKCGNTEGKRVTDDKKYIVCFKCSHNWTFKCMPLFIVIGASGVGKTSTCFEMMQHEKDYIVMDSDLFFFMPHNTPEELKFKREILLEMVKGISQIGKPVVLNAAALPEQFENNCNRQYFSDIHYIALVCEPEILEKRMRDGRDISDEDWISGSISFNNWFRLNASCQTPVIDLCDTTNKTVSEAAQFVDKWVKEKMKAYVGLN